MSFKQSVIFLAGIESLEVEYLSIPAKLVETMSIFSCFLSGTPVRKSTALQLLHKEVPEDQAVKLETQRHIHLFSMFSTVPLGFLLRKYHKICVYIIYITLDFSFGEFLRVTLSISP